MIRAISVEELTDVFAPGGKLECALDDYEFRADQLEFSCQVAKALATNQHALLEAGTGMGKTYGYLVPLLLSGARVQLTTSTRNLQEQLTARDIPRLLKALELTADVQMLKGRANYICKKRLIEASEHDMVEEIFPDATDQLKADLKQVTSHTLSSKDGDIAGVNAVKRNSRIWPLATSTKANCSGSNCDYYDECFFYTAVKRTQAADLVVANHALTMISTTHDLDLMGSFNAVLFDEAHELVDSLPRYFAKQINFREQANLFAETRQKISKALQPQVSSLLERICQLFEEMASQAKKAADQPEDRNYRAAKPLLNEKLNQQEGYQANLNDLQSSLAKLISHLPDPPEPEENKKTDGRGDKDGDELLVDLKIQTKELISELRLWHDASDEIFAWVEAGEHNVIYWRVPVKTADLFRKYLLDQQSTICVSSTLAVDQSLEYPSMILGMDEAIQGIWESPFNYADNSLLWLPPDLPPPTTDQGEHVKQSVELAVELIMANQGNAFLLFATLTSMKIATKQLRAKLDDAYELLVQNEDDARALVARFARKDDIPRVLVGSKTFWQGVDVPGATLSLVLIDKIPFSPPSDPIQYMRTEQLEDPTKAFHLLAVPKATMQLKQAAGRLIRSASDRGVLVLCDPRLANRYGKRILDSLQPMHRAQSKQETLEFIRDKS